MWKRRTPSSPLLFSDVAEEEEEEEEEEEGVGVRGMSLPLVLCRFLKSGEGSAPVIVAG